MRARDAVLSGGGPALADAFTNAFVVGDVRSLDGWGRRVGACASVGSTWSEVRGVTESLADVKGKSCSYDQDLREPPVRLPPFLTESCG